MTGTETLVLRADNTCEQFYDDGGGHIYTSPGNRWSLQGNQIHLEDGQYYPLGVQRANDFAEGKLTGSIFYEHGEWSSEFRATTPTVVVLDVRPFSLAPRGWVLKYPGMGIAPEFPEFVKFEQVTTSTLTPTLAP